MLPAPILSTVGQGTWVPWVTLFPRLLRCIPGQASEAKVGSGQAGAVWRDLQAGWPGFWCSSGRHVESVPLYGQLSLIVIV